MSNPITLGDAYWEHQQLQKQINEQTKKAQLYAGFDMNATFDRLFNQSNEEYEKLTDQGVFAVRLRLLFAVISPDWLRRVFWAFRLILLPLSVALTKNMKN
jgi:hypothetical protein